MRNALNPPHHEGHQGHEGNKKNPFVLKIFSPENIWALVLFLIVVALIVLTTDDSPNWIYQGF
jgi:hypothetical protein